MLDTNALVPYVLQQLPSASLRLRAANGLV